MCLSHVGIESYRYGVKGEIEWGLVQLVEHEVLSLSVIGSSPISPFNRSR